jgi:MerR family transcriptional regulator, copper efflux regulator
MVQSQEQLLKIGVIADRAGVSIDTVRYYERRGLLTPAERLPSGYRLYRESTVERIHLARRMQGLGMSLEEVASALQAHDRGGATCESERWRLEAVHQRITAKMAELSAVREAIDNALARCADGDCALRGTRLRDSSRSNSPLRTPMTAVYIAARTMAAGGDGPGDNP